MTNRVTKEPKDVDKLVGARIRTRRREIGMSQESLAEQCGVSFQQIQKYEKGSNRVSMSMMVEIAKATRAPLTYFFEGLVEGEAGAAQAADLNWLAQPGAAKLVRLAKLLPPNAVDKLASVAEVLAEALGLCRKAPGHG